MSLLKVYYYLWQADWNTLWNLGGSASFLSFLTSPITQQPVHFTLKKKTGSLIGRNVLSPPIKQELFPGKFSGGLGSLLVVVWHYTKGLPLALIVAPPPDMIVSQSLPPWLNQSWLNNQCWLESTICTCKNWPKWTFLQNCMAGKNLRRYFCDLDCFFAMGNSCSFLNLFGNALHQLSPYTTVIMVCNDPRRIYTNRLLARVCAWTVCLIKTVRRCSLDGVLSLNSV